MNCGVIGVEELGAGRQPELGQVEQQAARERAARR